MREARETIETLAQQEGVNLAMIVSRDGFVIEYGVGRELPIEPEPLGAVVSTYWTTVDAIGRELSAGQGNNGLVECGDAVISTALIANEELILTVVTDKETNPAMIRYLTVKFSSLLEQML